MQWYVIFKKEMLENWRHLKWIWVPIIFIIFAAMDPVTTYYLPKIMEAVESLPEDALINIPVPNATEAIMMSVGELGILGVFITVIIAMGTISGEMKKGVYELILSKPVKYTNYVSAKFLSYLILNLVSLMLALIASWYLVILLFGSLDFMKVLTSILFYSAYFALIIAIVLMVNTWVQSPGIVAGVSLLLIIALNVITEIYGHLLTWSPALMSDYIHQYINSGTITTDMWYCTLTALIFTIICLQFAVLTLRNRALY